MLPSIVLATTSGGSGGPPFFDQLRTNGLFGGLAGVGLIVPFFLAGGAGLLSGESIAAEAAGGTLRYLLGRPVGRVRLVLTKYWSVMALLGLSVLWVMAVGLAAGGIAFGYGPMPTLSGGEISGGAAVVRSLVSAADVLACVDRPWAIRVCLS